MIVDSLLMAAKRTQLSEGASTKLENFHRNSSVVRPSLYMYFTLSSRVTVSEVYAVPKVYCSLKQLPRAFEPTTYMALWGLVNGS